MDNFDLAYSVLHALDVPNISDRTGWVTSSCPFAPYKHATGLDRSPSFGIRIEDLFCNCFSCGTAGKLDSLLFELQQLNRKAQIYPSSAITEAWRVLNNHEAPRMSIPKIGVPAKNEVQIWPESWLRRYIPAPEHYYLKERGLSAKARELLEPRWDVEGCRIILPFRDWAGRLCGAQGRTLIDAKPKYLHYRYANVVNDVWAGEHLCDLLSTLYIVEGPLDRARLLNYTTNVIASMGTPSRNKLARLKHFDRIVILFDQDEAGQKMAEKAATYLRTQPKRTVCIGAFDAKDLGELPEKELQALFQEFD